MTGGRYTWQKPFCGLAYRGPDGVYGIWPLCVCRCRRRMAALAITVMAALAQPSGEQRHMPASLTQVDDKAACLLTQLLDMPDLPGPQWYPLPFPLFHPRTSRVPPDDRQATW